MRKLRLQVQMSIDGYIAGPNGEMDWMVWNWDDELKKYVGSITEPVDCIVLGRKLAQGFIPHWAGHPEQEGAEKINSTKKVVFTKTLDKSEWANTVLAKGDLVDEITKLKKQDGGDMIAYGGATFVSNLIKHELIDELHLFVNPAAIGSGMAIFKDLQKFKLVKATPFACGMVVLHYEPNR
ncbi:MAG TPA: dihydrofolate reductase family protein [Chryseolinea sp.]